jgi:hypothetical protein
MVWAGHVARMVRRGMPIGYWSENQKERDHWVDHDVGGWTISKCILERQDLIAPQLQNQLCMYVLFPVMWMVFGWPPHSSFIGHVALVNRLTFGWEGGFQSGSRKAKFTHADWPLILLMTSCYRIRMKFYDIGSLHGFMSSCVMNHFTIPPSGSSYDGRDTEGIIHQVCSSHSASCVTQSKKMAHCWPHVSPRLALWW